MLYFTFRLEHLRLYTLLMHRLTLFLTLLSLFLTLLSDLASRQYLCLSNLVKNVRRLRSCVATAKQHCFQLATKLSYWQWQGFQCQWQTAVAQWIWIYFCLDNLFTDTDATNARIIVCPMHWTEYKFTLTRPSVRWPSIRRLRLRLWAQFWTDLHQIWNVASP